MTFKEEFDNFMAYRIGVLDKSYSEIRALYRNLTEETEEITSKIESLASNRAYKIGFRDGIRLMAGL